MSKSEKEFKKYLKIFINELHQLNPTENTKKIINVFNKLNIKKVTKRYYNSLSEHKDLVSSKNNDIFKKDINILPNINLKDYWNKCNKNEDKTRFWSMINVLFVLSTIINSESENKTKTESNDEKEFNPYVGIKNNNDKYSINEMFGGPKDLPVEKKKEESGLLSNIKNLPNLKNLGNLANLGNLKNLGDIKNLEKLIDMKKFSEDIKNINNDEIAEATGNIKKLLGKNADEKTSNLLSDMLDSITNELQGNNISEGDPISNIMKVAEKVANKMKPRIESENIDLQNVVQSSDLGGNPMSLFQELMKKHNDLNNNTSNKSE